MVSIRMSEELITLLENVRKVEGSFYFDRDKTWLIEHAIKQQYQHVISAPTPR